MADSQRKTTARVAKAKAKAKRSPKKKVVVAAEAPPSPPVPVPVAKPLTIRERRVARIIQKSQGG